MKEYSIDKFFAYEELKEEFLLFQKMTAEQREAFGRANKAKVASLSEDEKREYYKQMAYGLQVLKDEAEELSLYEKMGAITKYVSLSQIAQDYFGKSRYWLYQRLKGLMVNGKEAQFTPEERRKLAEALLDISKKIQETALKIA